MKALLIIASIIIIIGSIMFVGVMSYYKWDFSKLSTQTFETNVFTLSEDFSDISIDTKTAKIIILPATDETTKIECYEDKKTKHSVTVSQNELKIELVDQREWHDFINIFNKQQKITVYLSKKQYASLSIAGDTGSVNIPNDFTFENITVNLSTGDLTSCASASNEIKIKTSTGNVTCENTNCKALNISVNTGKINAKSLTVTNDVTLKMSTGNAVMTDVECGSLTTKSSTGNLTLTNVVAEESFDLESSTGNIKFDSCDANEITVKTSTGNVKGSLLTNKIFFTQSDTGKINVPKSTSGGKCDISTDTGDIIISIS